MKQPADQQLLDWINSAEFKQRHADWWRTFDARLATGDALTEADVAAAVDDFAAKLDLPPDAARGLFARELDPDAWKKFVDRPLQ